jgi:hypothetical protein
MHWNRLVYRRAEGAQEEKMNPLFFLFTLIGIGSLMIGVITIALFGVGAPFERHFDKGMAIGNMIVAIGAVVCVVLAATVLLESLI